MIRIVALISMALSLFLRRILCRHTWKTTKHGWVWSIQGVTLRGADIQVCQVCGKVRMVTTDLKVQYGVHRISKLFIPEVVYPGDEDVGTYQIQVMNGEWTKVKGGLLHRGVAMREMRNLQDCNPGEHFQVIPEAKNGWNKIPNPL